MLEWFTEVLCWKQSGVIDSSTVANAYIWLTAEFGNFLGTASCNVMPSITI